MNLQYQFILRGDNTESTDFRKPVKLKTPKAKAKIKKRPSASTFRAKSHTKENKASTMF